MDRPLTQDEARNIQNAQRHGTTEDRIVQADRNTVANQFEREKSVQAQVGNKKPREEEELSRREQLEYAYQEERQLRARSQSVGKQIKGTSKRKAASTLKKFGPAKWLGLGFVATLYFWIQLPAGIIAALGFGGHGYIIAFQESTVTGNALSYIIDFSNYFPGEYIGWAGLVISIIVSLGIIITYSIWFKMNGIAPFGSTIATQLLSIVLITLCFLPFVNVFPWALLWIISRNVFSLFSSE
jgi:hypothetical protein